MRHASGRPGGGRPVPAALIVVLVLAAGMSLAAPAGRAWAQDGAEPGAAGTAEETAWQAASFLATIPYGAVKVGVAAVGGLIGGVGYLLSGGDLDASQRIWSSFMDGTYVLGPEHLKGKAPVVLFVPPQEPTGEP